MPQRYCNTYPINIIFIAMVIFVSIFAALFIVYAYLIDSYRRWWNKIPENNFDSAEPSTFITVIVPARNEENNIAVALESLHQQSYNKDLYEVIVVDDHSEDRTVEVVHSYTSGMKVTAIRLQDHLSGQAVSAHKKKAIETAIGQAKGSLVVTTDADCHFHPQWLHTLAAFHEKYDAKFIAAPVKIDGKKSLLSIFQTLDFLTLQGITGAAVYKRFHSMCNGANLAYEKKAFYEVNGFNGIDAIASGDDMLLMHKIYRNYPEQVFYLKSKQAIVTTQAVETWKGFFHQRIRWASKAEHYDDKRIFYVLLLVYLLNVCYFGLAVWAFFSSNAAFLLMLFFLAKLLIEFPFVNSVALFFGQHRLMNYFLVLQPLHILYTLIAGWLGKFGSFEWKGRTITTK
jgi:cellulose synthase/poly-beta-1,6-N-acetylglucosamine synthase-like glycosyltransferase